MEIKEFIRPASDGRAVLRVYLPELNEQIMSNYDRPGMLIIPGGGYHFVSGREGEPIAMKYFTAGVIPFVLTSYSVAPHGKFPAPLLDAMWAMDFIRKHAEEFRIDPHKLAVCGFSAGGHLAASLCVFHNRQDYAQLAGAEVANLRPDAAILGYPVITARRDVAHLGSFENLLVDEADDEEMRRFVSLEEQVPDDMPPCFLWHTGTDESVPVANSLLFAQALAKHKIHFEMHIFEDGVHGLSLAQRSTAKNDSQINPDAARWAELSVSWLMRTLNYL